MKAYVLIQKKIASGELAAGSLISELALAKELGSSRTPVREAAGQLLAEGMLELSPGGGIVVTQLTRQGIVDLYELREALEVFAVGRAAQTVMRVADRQRLESLIEETQILVKELKASGKKELSPEQMRRFSVSDLGFHALLIRMAANARILKVVNDAFTYCDGVYAALTDASGTQVVDVTQENGRQTRNLRMGLLTLNYGHNNEIYGSMVVYLRMKNLVPPASEPRPQQKK